MFLTSPGNRPGEANESAPDVVFKRKSITIVIFLLAMLPFTDNQKSLSFMVLHSYGTCVAHTSQLSYRNEQRIRQVVLMKVFGRCRLWKLYGAGQRTKDNI